ncbi:MAG: hypothetical protein WC517_00135 [Patescibacteria group bacterium]
MSTIHIGTINLRELDKKVRRAFPRQTEKVHSSPRGKRGYDRKQAKRAWQKGDS